MIVTYIFDITPDGYVFNVKSFSSLQNDTYLPSTPVLQNKRYIATIEIPDIYPIEISKVIEIKNG